MAQGQKLLQEDKKQHTARRTLSEILSESAQGKQATTPRAEEATKTTTPTERHDEEEAKTTRAEEATKATTPTRRHDEEETKTTAQTANHDEKATKPTNEEPSTTETPSTEEARASEAGQTAATRRRLTLRVGPSPAFAVLSAAFRGTAGKRKEGKTQRKSFPSLLTQAVRGRLREAAAKIDQPSRRAAELTARVRRHHELVGGPVRETAAAFLEVLRPSTAKTYIGVLRTEFPAENLRNFQIAAQRKMLTQAGRPKAAAEISPQRLQEICGQVGPRLRNTLRVMWVLAARHGDLAHMAPRIVQNGREPATLIEMLCREGAEGLVPPKADNKATKRLVKWASVFPDVNFAGPFSTYEDVRAALAPAGATPHSIRGSAIRFLQHRFSTEEIATLTNHAPAATNPGMKNYIARDVRDKAATTAIQMTKDLWRAISGF